MPRIAAALAVVITVATCISFNTVRYPVVGEMVAPAHLFPRSDQADRTVPILQSAGARQPETTRRPRSPSLGSADSPPPSNFASVGYYSMAVDPIPFDPTSDGNTEPIEASPSSKYGFGPVTETSAAKTRVASSPTSVAESPGLESGLSSPSFGRRPLVPVTPAPQPGRSEKRERWILERPVGLGSGSRESSSRGNDVVRLPAIDAVSQVPHSVAGRIAPGGQIPIYPSTGSR